MIEFFIRRPISVIMFFITILTIGLFSLESIPTTLLPDSDVPKLEIVVENPNMLPEVFDKEVILPIRNSLIQLNGIRDLNSYSNNNISNIGLIFEYGADMNLLFFEVNERIDEILSSLPYRIQRPKVVRQNISDVPSIYLAISPLNYTEKSFYELSSFVNSKLKTRLEQCDEISFVDISGLANSVVQISVKKSVTKPLGISLDDIKIAIDNGNYSYGNIEISQNHYVYNISIDNTINSVNEIKETKLNSNGRLIKISEIADVQRRITFDDEYYYKKKKALSLAILKSPNHSENKFIKVLNNIIEDIQRQNPNVLIGRTKNQVDLLNKTLNSLAVSLLLGLFFSGVITLLFLKSIKAVILIAVSIFSSLTISVLFFHWFDVSINLISLSGVILGVGLMIDNIIIVLDNIGQKTQEKNGVFDGVSEGVIEIAPALIASSFTTCSIFIPLIFLSGLAGVLFYDQAIAVSITLMASFFVSVILLPSLYMLLYKSSVIGNKNKKIYSFYKKINNAVQRKTTMFILILSVIMALGLSSFFLIEKSQLPDLDTSELVFKIDWGKDYTNEILITKSNNLIEFIENDIVSSEYYINKPSFISKTQRKNIGEYESYFTLNIKKNVDKNLLEKKILSYVRNVNNEADLIYLTEENALNSLLLNDEYNLQIVCYDESLSVDSIESELNTNFPRALTSTIGTKERIHITFNLKKMLLYDIDVKSFIRDMKLRLGQERLFDLNYGNNYIPVTFFNPDNDLSTILNSHFISKNGVEYRIKDFVDVKYKILKKGIEADIGGIANVISLKTDKPLSTIDFIKSKYPDSSIAFKGSFEYLESLKKESVSLILITIVLLYLILSIQFESLVLPLIILIEVPIAISFSILVLFLANQTLNVMSFIGIAVMCGIIVNDSILKIDLIRKLHRSGNELESAISMASKRRLDAILMTSLTTIFSITPILLQSDISGKLQSPLVISLIGGLVLGTFISIFMIPLLYKKLTKRI